MRKPTPVTTSIMTQESGSSCIPTLTLRFPKDPFDKWNAPAGNQVYKGLRKTWWYDSGRPRNCTKHPSAQRKDRPGSPTETAETARFEDRRPKKSWMAAPRSGKTGINQM